MPITLTTTKSKSLPGNKKRSGRSKNETKIPRPNPSNIPSRSSLQSMASNPIYAPSNTHQIGSNLSPLDTIKSKEVGKNEKTLKNEEKVEKKKFQLRKKNSLFL